MRVSAALFLALVCGIAGFALPGVAQQAETSTVWQCTTFSALDTVSIAHDGRWLVRALELPAGWQPVAGSQVHDMTLVTACREGAPTTGWGVTEELIRPQ